MNKYILVTIILGTSIIGLKYYIKNKPIYHQCDNCHIKFKCKNIDDIYPHKSKNIDCCQSYVGVRNYKRFCYPSCYFQYKQKHSMPLCYQR